MDKPTTPFLLLLLYGFAFAIPGNQVTPPESTVKILFIGNSYTYYNDMPAIFAQLVESNTKFPSAKVSAVTPDGYTFEDHWNSQATRELIFSENWDYVILQEQSMMPVNNPENMRQYGKKLISLVLEQHARPILFMTWARKNNPDMLTSIVAAYKNTGIDSSVTIAPIGIAWQTFHRNFPEINLYDRDGSHPGIYGSYLTALVIFNSLFLPDQVNEEIVVNGIDKAVAIKLTQSAIRTVENALPLTEPR